MLLEPVLTEALYFKKSKLISIVSKILKKKYEQVANDVYFMRAISQSEYIILWVAQKGQKLTRFEVAIVITYSSIILSFLCRVEYVPNILN